MKRFAMRCSSLLSKQALKSDLRYRWMSKEPAEIFERAAEDGFIRQLKHHSTVSQFGQLRGALSLDGVAMRSHFQGILYNQVRKLFTWDECYSHLTIQILNGKFANEFSKIEADLEKTGDDNPLERLYKQTEASELGQAEIRVRHLLQNVS
jgi:ketol-acid reductoisomerase